MKYSYLLAVGAAYWLYQQHQAKQSTSAFLSGADYNEIYQNQWWG